MKKYLISLNDTIYRRENSLGNKMRGSVPLRIFSCLVVFFLLIIVITSNIQLASVQADQDLEFHQITVQPWGLKGSGPTTVNLTTEQYRSFKQYLVTFHERLNTTKNYKQTARLYAETLTELVNLHLIPRNCHWNLQGDTLVKDSLNQGRGQAAKR
jgi:hypothetical protein